jgi:cytochrome c5
VEEQTDKVFIRNFSVVLVLLIVFTIVIIFIARDVGFKDGEPVQSKIANINERLKPVSGVYTGEAGAAAMQAAVASANEAPKVAFDGSLDGEMIYGAVCAACHNTAVLGAPKPGSPEMAQRAAAGMDVLFDHAINGINSMPARGGRPDLSDDQMHAVIDFMLK